MLKRFFPLLLAALVLLLTASLCAPAVQPQDGSAKGVLTVTAREGYTEYNLSSQEAITLAQFVFIGDVNYDASEGACSVDAEGFHTCTFKGSKTAYAMNIAGEVLGLNAIFKLEGDVTPYFLEAP